MFLASGGEGRHQVEEGQAKLIKPASPALSRRGKEEQHGKRAVEEQAIGDRREVSISTDSGRIRSATGGSRQSLLDDEDTGAFSGRNDPLRTSIPENIHMDEDPVWRFFEYQASLAASKVLSDYGTERPGVLTGVLSLDLLEQEGMIMASPEQRVIIVHQEEPMAFPESRCGVLLREEPLAFQGQQQVVAVNEELRRVPEAAADRHGSFRGSVDKGSSLETGAEAFLNS
jgi:hypothetical protein